MAPMTGALAEVPTEGRLVSGEVSTGKYQVALTDIGEDSLDYKMISTIHIDRRESNSRLTCDHIPRAVGANVRITACDLRVVELRRIVRRRVVLEPALDSSRLVARHSKVVREAAARVYDSFTSHLGLSKLLVITERSC